MSDLGIADLGEKELGIRDGGERLSVNRIAE